MALEAEKSLDLPSVSWRPGKDSVVVQAEAIDLRNREPLVQLPAQGQRSGSQKFLVQVPESEGLRTRSSMLKGRR